MRIKEELYLYGKIKYPDAYREIKKGGLIMLLNDDQRMIADLVTKISKEKIAPQAAEIDRTQSIPSKGLHNLAETELLGITVPET